MSDENRAWVDTPEKAAWRALLPEAAAKIANFYTPGDQVGDRLAEVLAARVLSLAYKRRADLLPTPTPTPDPSPNTAAGGVADVTTGGK